MAVDKAAHNNPFVYKGVAGAKQNKSGLSRNKALMGK
jgi:hypothetical protein|tara:strand:- start:131 stop:241 length:111 start_codon:yes stop_codon:yes gene_type:complete